jgi:hypothetical protein
MIVSLTFEIALAVPSVSPLPRQTLRPSSPTTTIKNSIINAEIKLNDRRSRLKRSKNDHKLHISKVKKELENFNNRLSSGGDENRQKQRSLQLERNIRQTEEATALIDGQLDNLEKIPEEELKEWSSRKTAFEQEMEKLKSVKAELDAARSAASRSISSAESELASVVQKRERLQSRQNRLTEQYERITNANNQGLNERERKAAEQLAKEREHARIEESFHEQLTNLTRSVQEYQVRTAQLWHQASAIEHAFQQQLQQQQQLLMNTGPLTPEGNLPGINPQPLEATGSTVPTTAMTSCSRSILGLPYPLLNASDKSNPHQSSMSPIHAKSLVSASEQQQYPSPPLASTNHFFGPELNTRRGRSWSNFSSRSAQPDYSAPIVPVDSSDSTAEGARKSGSVVMGFGNSTSHFTRTGSGGSGSGSASGSGSPHSVRGKVPWG